MKKINVALVGFGISGQCFQAPIITQCAPFKLVAVVSSDVQKVRSQLSGITVYATIEEMLINPDIDLVVIATPNQLHVPQAQLALKAGKHVVVEKPFSVTTQEGKDLLEMQAGSGKLLTVYQSRRFDGDFKTIKKLVEEQKLAGIHTFYSSYNRYRPEVKVRWREQDVPGAGILYDLGAHLIDQALCLFGLPKRVTALLRHQRPNSQAVDHFHLILEYENCEAILHGNCLSTAEGPRFQVFANNGTYIKYGMDTQEDFLRERKGPDTSGWGTEPASRFGLYTDNMGAECIIETETGSYQDFYLQLASAISEGTPLPVTPEEALNVISVIEAAYLSSEQHRSVGMEEVL